MRVGHDHFAYDMCLGPGQAENANTVRILFPVHAQLVVIIPRLKN